MTACEARTEPPAASSSAPRTPSVLDQPGVRFRRLARATFVEWAAVCVLLWLVFAMEAFTDEGDFGIRRLVESAILASVLIASGLPFCLFFPAIRYMRNWPTRTVGNVLRGVPLAEGLGTAQAVQVAPVATNRM